MENLLAIFNNEDKKKKKKKKKTIIATTYNYLKDFQKMMENVC